MVSFCSIITCSSRCMNPWTQLRRGSPHVDESSGSRLAWTRKPYSTVCTIVCAVCSDERAGTVSIARSRARGTTEGCDCELSHQPEPAGSERLDGLDQRRVIELPGVSLPDDTGDVTAAVEGLTHRFVKVDAELILREGGRGATRQVRTRRGMPSCRGGAACARG